MAFVYFAAALLIMTAVVSGQPGNGDISCYHCHSREVNEFQNSVHFNKNISCTDCHGGDTNVSGGLISISAMGKNFSGVPSRSNITDFCSKCHSEAVVQYKQSIHWKELMNGRAESASCIDCHGTHGILPSENRASLTNSTNVPMLCASCHENQTKMSAWYYGIQTDRFDTYKKSYHYKAFLSGGKGLATCPDCHENHNTRAQIDPQSTIYPANLANTCGKPDCHPGKSVLVSGGKIHEGQSVYFYFIDAKKLVTYFYIIMILFELTFTIGLILLAMNSNFEIRRRK